MKILAGAQHRKKKNITSFSVMVAHPSAEQQAIPAPLTDLHDRDNRFFIRAVWGLLFLAMIEAGFMAGMIYRMPMSQPYDMSDEQQDAGNAMVVLDDQARQLGLLNRNGQANAPVAAYPSGPITYHAITRLADADIPGLPANLAKQQQALDNNHQDLNTLPETPLAEKPEPVVAEPVTIPRAKMPHLEFHTIFDGLGAPAATDTPPAATKPTAPTGDTHHAERPQAAMPSPGTFTITPHPGPAPSATASAGSVVPGQTWQPVRPGVEADPRTAPAHALSSPLSPRDAPETYHASHSAPQAPAPSERPPASSRPVRPVTPPDAIGFEPQRMNPPARPRMLPGPAVVDEPPMGAPARPNMPPPAMGRPPVVVPVRPDLPRPPVMIDPPPVVAPRPPEPMDGFAQVPVRPVAPPDDLPAPRFRARSADPDRLPPDAPLEDAPREP